MSQVNQFLAELEQGTFPLASTREWYAKLQESMSPHERARALKLISKLEVEALNKPVEMSPLLRLLPKGWLQDYLLMCQMSEAPDSFHLFSALAALTHRIGRRMWYSYGTVDIYAPMSAFLVSPAGAARRSTAIKTALRVGQEAGAVVVQDTITPEGLIDWLSSEPQTLVAADEATTLLSRSEYMSQMPQILCSLLDCPTLFSRKLRDEFIQIRNPTVNALIGCAPDWIMTSMPKSAVEGGLFSRLIIVYEQSRKRLIPMPEDEIDMGSLGGMIQTLVGRLRAAVEQAEGKLTYSLKAKEKFKRFYIDNDKHVQSSDDKLSIYLVRKPEHLHRLNMAILAASGAGNEVTVEVLETGLAILASIESRMSEAYKSAGLEKPGQHQMKVLAALDRVGGRIDHSTLLQRVSSTMSAQDLQRCMQSLEEQGVLRAAVREGKRGLIRYYERTS